MISDKSMRKDLELSRAYELGYKELGGLRSNCPYSSDKGEREAQLANAWMSGYTHVHREAGKIISANRNFIDDRRERDALADSDEQSNDLNYVQDPLGRGFKMLVGGHMNHGSHAGSFSTRPFYKPRIWGGSDGNQGEGGSVKETSNEELLLQIGRLEESINQLHKDSQKSGIELFLELAWGTIVFFAVIKVLFS